MELRMTILGAPCLFMAATVLATESATRRDGVSGEGAAKGESAARRALRATATAVGVEAVAVKAL